MTSRRGRVFTPHVISAIRRMAEQGQSASEIAKVIGSTPASVRVRCSLQKIKLRRGRRPAAHNSTARGYIEHTVIAHMPAPLYAEFHRKAEHMQKSVTALASSLLVAIATSNIYEAVLDEDDQPGAIGPTAVGNGPTQDDPVQQG